MTTERARRVYQRRCEQERVAHVFRLCTRIEAGESLTEICRDPTMPRPSTMRFWLRRHPDLGRMVAEAEERAAGFYPPRREYHRFDEAVASEFLIRIEDGRGTREVCAEPDMPVHATVYRWMRERPEFDKAYRQAREAQADRLFDLAWRIACEATEASVEVDRLKIQTLKHRIARLAPRKYGTLKAQEPERAADAPQDEADSGPAKRFYVRHFARTPENTVVETTEATWGKSPDEIKALNEAIRRGEIGVPALEAMKRWALEEVGEG